MNYTGQISHDKKARAGNRIRRRENIFRFGPFRFRQSTCELLRGSKKIPLKVQSAKVLGILLEKHGQLVTREELISKIWPNRTVEFDLSLNSCLRDIRHALSDNPKDPRFVETLSKRGYRFIGEVQTYPDNPFGMARARVLKPVMAAGLVMAGVLIAGGFFAPSIVKNFKATQPVPVEVTEEARTLMLAGVSALYDFDVPKTAEALALFDQAVAADPGFIEAYIMTARTVFARGAPEDAPRALTALDKILELDPYNVEAMAMTASIKWTLVHDFEGARQSFERLLEVDPNYNRAYLGLAGVYLLKGDADTSLAQVNQALSLDTIQMTQSGRVGWFYYLAGRHEEGVAFCRETLAVNSEDVNAYRCFVNHMLALGETEGAADQALGFLEAAGLSGQDFENLKSAPAAKVLDYFYGFEAGQDNPGRFEAGRVYQAIALTRRGDTQKALEVLSLAYQERNYYLPYIAVIPALDPLRQTPEFQALVQAMDLSDNFLNS